MKQTAPGNPEKIRVAVIGPYPPPLGGISIYVKRLCNKLKRDGRQVELFEWGSLTRLSKLAMLWRLLRGSFAEIHLNDIARSLALVLILTGLARKTIYTSHGNRAEHWSFYEIKLYSAFFSRCAEIILVGGHLQEIYDRKGVTLSPNVVVKPAYLPPDQEEEETILATYSGEILRFARERQPLLIANAYQLVFFEGTDLYGLDMCVDLISSLKEEYPQIGLLFALADVGDRDYFERTQNLLQERGLVDNFYFMTGQRELWPLFKKADLMVRPTCIDGFGISVAEALDLGCAAVASDVCERAAGTTLFAARDGEDFLAKCRMLLNQTRMVRG